MNWQHIPTHDCTSFENNLLTAMDKLQLTGQNLGRVFNSRSGRMCVMPLCCYEAKWANLKFKTRPKQLLGSLRLAFALPTFKQYSKWIFCFMLVLVLWSVVGNISIHIGINYSVLNKTKGYKYWLNTEDFRLVNYLFNTGNIRSKIGQIVTEFY
jgi:hypothetical protein